MKAKALSGEELLDLRMRMDHPEFMCGHKIEVKETVKRLLATVDKAHDADGDWSRKDPETWVLFTLGKLAAVTSSKAYKEAASVRGEIIAHAVMTASTVAYLDRDTRYRAADEKLEAALSALREIAGNRECVAIARAGAALEAIEEIG